MAAKKPTTNLGSETGSTDISATNSRTEVGDGDASESSLGESQPQTPPSESEKTNDVLCKCGKTAPLATVKTQGPNCGRKFYKCGNLNKCVFFRWADNQPPVFRPVVKTGVDRKISNLCRCNYPAKLLGNDISSNLRGFFGCGNPKGRSCNFFQWSKTGNSASIQAASISGAETGRTAAPSTNIKDVNGSDDHEDIPEESSSRSPNVGLLSADGKSDILCMCGHVALLRTVKSPGGNYGRKFYMCGNKRRCIFFRWGDEKFRARPAVMNAVVENVAVTCQCDQPAKVQTVHKAGPNTGRQFFACAKPRGRCCTFFQWVNTSHNKTVHTVSSPDRSVRRIGGKSRKAAAIAKNLKEVGSNNDSEYEQESSPQSVNQITKSESDETNDVLCTCGYGARLLTVKTEGPNCGRQFYKCGNTNSCHFFLWADDELLALRVAVQMNGVNENFTVACRCDNPAKLLTVEKDGPNSGRQFYGCEQSCGFFQWVGTENDILATNNSFLVTKEEYSSDHSEDDLNNSGHLSEDPEFDPSKLDPPSEDVSNRSLPDKRKRKRARYWDYEYPLDHAEDDPNSSGHFSEAREFDPLKLDPPSDDVSNHSLPEKRKRKCALYLDYVYFSDKSEDDSNNSGSASEDQDFNPLKLDPPEDVSDQPVSDRPVPDQPVPDQPIPEKPKKKCGLCLNLDHNRKTCPKNRSRRK